MPERFNGQLHTADDVLELDNIGSGIPQRNDFSASNRARILADQVKRAIQQGYDVGAQVRVKTSITFTLKIES